MIRLWWLSQCRAIYGHHLAVTICLHFWRQLQTATVWSPLRPLSVVEKNKPLTMFSSRVQSIDLPMDSMVWRCWTMRKLNGCSTPASRSSAAKQWFKQLAQTKEEIWSHSHLWLVRCEHGFSFCLWFVFEQYLMFNTASPNLVWNNGKGCYYWSPDIDRAETR